MFGFLKSIFGGQAKPAPAPQGFKSLPAPADGESYHAQLVEILSAHDVHAVGQIRGALDHLHDKTQELHIGIHPDQDGEGTFSVMLHPVGPDIYVLNKTIGSYRLLFDIKRVHGGLNVAVPLFDPDEATYEVRDIIADAAADWAERLWQTAGETHPDLPVMVFCDEGWGQTTPRWLQGKPQ